MESTTEINTPSDDQRICDNSYCDKNEFINNSNVNNNNLIAATYILSFLLYYQNCQGLRTKTNIFYRNASGCDYDIIALSETWLRDAIGDSELFGGG